MLEKSVIVSLFAKAPNVEYRGGDYNPAESLR
jgi:hypothetical protein